MSCFPICALYIYLANWFVLPCSQSILYTYCTNKQHIYTTYAITIHMGIDIPAYSLHTMWGLFHQVPMEGYVRVTRHKDGMPMHAYHTQANTPLIRTKPRTYVHKHTRSYNAHTKKPCRLLALLWTCHDRRGGRGGGTSAMYPGKKLVEVDISSPRGRGSFYIPRRKWRSRSSNGERLDFKKSHLKNFIQMWKLSQLAVRSCLIHTVNNIE